MTTLAPATQTRTTTTNYVLDPAHSNVEFSVRHLMISTVKGAFRLFEGAIEAPGNDPTRARVTARIDAASVTTGADARDDHLRSPDFFDVANHPAITFDGRAIEVQDEDRFKLAGELTIRGVTRPVELDVEREGEAVDPWGKRRVAFSARTRFDRADFGLTWNQALEAGGVLVSDTVKVTLNLSFVQADAS